MRSKDDGSTRVPPPAESLETPPAAPLAPPWSPPNAFDGAFLGRLDERDEPPTALEADLAGPWRVERLPEGPYGVFRQGEGPSRGQTPAALCKDRWHAQLIAALLPILARDPAYRFCEDEEEDGEGGYALESREAWGAEVGRFLVRDPAVPVGLHVLEGLMRSPLALALLLEACGKVALERAGAILEERIGSGG